MVKPDGDVPFPPCKAKRSHSSRVGSALGVFKACESFLIFTAGVAGIALLGDEAGDELRARFRFFRPIIGDILCESRSGMLCHSSCSAGASSSSSFNGDLVSPIRSCQTSLVTGVGVLSALWSGRAFSLSAPSGSASDSLFPFSSASAGGGRNWNLWSLFFVLSEIGTGARVWAA